MEGTATTALAPRRAAAGCAVGDPSDCPVETTLSVVNGKWKPLILFHLRQGGARFNALRRLMPGVTQRVLTLSLRELERDGLVAREVVGATAPPGVEYSVTPLGLTLTPVFEAMAAWGAAYRAERRPAPAGGPPPGG